MIEAVEKAWSKGRKPVLQNAQYLIFYSVAECCLSGQARTSLSPVKALRYALRAPPPKTVRSQEPYIPSGGETFVSSKYSSLWISFAEDAAAVPLVL
jgi:hypothetical protein